MVNRVKGTFQPIFSIDINTHSDSKVYFKKLFFQNVFIDLLIDIITSAISSTQIACDVMCVRYGIQ